VRYQE
jgi:hypothetical protein